MKFEPDSALLAQGAVDYKEPLDAAAAAAALGGYLEALLAQRRYRHARKVMHFCMENWQDPSPIVLRYVLGKLKPYEFLIEYKEFYDFCHRLQPTLLNAHQALAPLLKPEKR